ncbi:MAG: hypothetical protein AAB403_02130 [Planctomycetota bacterium]
MTDAQNSETAPTERFRPYVAVAVLCEKVLREADGVLSAIRIVDRFFVSGPTPQMPPGNILTNLLIILKSGFFKGKAKVRVTPRTPDNQRMPELSFDQLFEGDDRGVAIIAQFAFPVAEEGLYWLDIAFEQDVLTSIPMRVVYRQVSTRE